MRKVITNEEMAVLKEAGEMFDETGCVPGVDGEQVPAEMIVPDAKPLAGTTLLGKQVGEGVSPTLDTNERYIRDCCLRFQWGPCIGEGGATTRVRPRQPNWVAWSLCPSAPRLQP
jgi:hypothetical protein